jgi:hypothetical protein
VEGVVILEDWHKIGGQIMAIKQREAALSSYYNNPKICFFCGKVIQVKECESASETRRKNFCNHSCSANYYNRLKPKKEKIVTQPKLKLLETITKGELRNRYPAYQSYRSAIQRDARKRCSHMEFKCKICGYSTHVDVCHIVDVSAFPDSAPIIEINSLDNLVLLCKNHHWEFDNGLLEL